MTTTPVLARFAHAGRASGALRVEGVVASLTMMIAGVVMVLLAPMLGLLPI
jgi:putative effector of murein hydrolase